jgi:acetyl esterase/lipase
MSRKPSTRAEYLAALNEERRAIVERLRATVRAACVVTVIGCVTATAEAQRLERLSPADTFLLQAEDDPVDPVENSLVYHAALRKAGVPTEIHLYAKGGHAFGLRRTSEPITAWPALVEQWLGTIRMIPR